MWKLELPAWACEAVIDTEEEEEGGGIEEREKGG